MTTGQPKHQIHKDLGIDKFDVFIAGSGPVGATYARLLVNEGYNVVMAEIGDQDTRIPGAHKKNEIEYAKDIDRFVKVIQGALSTCSIPPSTTVMPTLDPSAWRAADPSKSLIMNGRNPFQETHNNLGAEAVTRGVGGMSTHWTCATPRFLEGVERPLIFDDKAKDKAEWDLLYTASEALIGTSSTQFEHSIRHNVVLDTLQKAYPDRGVKPLPLACHRIGANSPYVMWHSAENVYGDLFTNPKKKNAAGVERGKFALLTNTRVTKLVREENQPHDKNTIAWVEVKDLLSEYQDSTETDSSFAIMAKIFVVASGAVGTPQILANSEFGALRKKTKAGQGKDAIPWPIPNLGLHITEQPMAFCQIVLHQGLVDNVGKDLANKPEWWRKAVEKHLATHPKDPCPIPFHDNEPQVCMPTTPERPWHAQIHRDAFSYGEAGPQVDPRVVVDLRFFGRQDANKDNKIIFEEEIRDAYGMPQPTFEYLPRDQFIEESSRMMKDMTEVANTLGGYLPISYPQFMTPGLALHLGGSIRLGQGKEKGQTVGDYNGQVWNFSNLYVAGNGTIPTAFAANPTLTSMSIAIRSAFKIAEDLKSGTCNPPSGTDVKPTPKDWVKWATDKNDPNFPDHINLRQLHKTVGAPN